MKTRLELNDLPASALAEVLKPFLELLGGAEPAGYGSPWHVQDRSAELAK